MKIYDKYKELKEQNSSKMYLFRNGNFYIFLDKDADLINEYVVLKKTNFTKDVQKCGFPVNSKEAYLKVFQNHGLNIEIIEKIEDNEENIFELLKKTNIDAITPIEALNLLYDMKRKLKWKIK